MKKLTIKDMTQIAIVAGLYVVLTIMPPLNAISYGAFQFRVAEMFNFLAFYHRKYLISVTLGCMIANFYTYGWVDVLVGGSSTLVFVSIGVFLFKRYQNQLLFNGLLNKAFFYFSIFFSLSMFTIALELVFVAKLPFLETWLATAIGEFCSLLLGSLVVTKLAKQIDFSK